MDTKTNINSKKEKPVLSNVTTMISIVLILACFFQGLFVLIGIVNGVNQFTSTVDVFMVSGITIESSIPGSKVQAIMNYVLIILCEGLSLVCYVLLWRFFNQIAERNKPFLSGQRKLLTFIVRIMILQMIIVIGCSTWLVSLSMGKVDLFRIFMSILSGLATRGFWPLIIYAMAMIFDYGMKLQDEADELL